MNMDHKISTYTFLEEFQKYIRPSINEIDLFIKTALFPLAVTDVACVLELDEAEVLSILKKLGLVTIDKSAFFAIMSQADSRICRLYARELEMGSPPIYTAFQISYIYNLDINDVKNACQKLQIKEVTAFTMPLIFSQIPY